MPIPRISPQIVQPDLYAQNKTENVQKSFLTKCTESAYSPWKDAIEEIGKIVKDKYVVVFTGFSGKGYEHVKEVEDTITSEIQKAVEQHKAENIVISAGATSDGIGMVYKIAKAMYPEIVTMGVVSREAQNYTSSISAKCDHTIYIPCPENEWEVLGTADAGLMNGESFTLAPIRFADSSSNPDDIAGFKGHIVAIGGGLISTKELTEAQKLGIKTVLYTDPVEYGPKVKSESLIKDNPVHFTFSKSLPATTAAAPLGAPIA